MRVFLLLFGVFTCATSIIFLKESAWPPIMLSAGRLLAAAILLCPIYLIAFKRAQQTEADLSHSALFKNSLLPAIMLGIHFISWIIGLRMTSISNATLIVNITPICMPIVLYVMIKEIPTKREYLSTAIAICGLGVIAYDDFQMDAQHFWGDCVCFASMFTFAIYLALARFYKQAQSIWLYVTPIYLISGFMCLIASLLFDDWQETSFAAREWYLVAALAIIPTIIGHSMLNAAMCWFRGQMVSIINMSQFVFAGTLAWILYRELPSNAFYVASSLIVIAAVLIIPKRSTDESESA